MENKNKTLQSWDDITVILGGVEIMTKSLEILKTGESEIKKSIEVNRKDVKDLTLNIESLTPLKINKQ